MANDKVKGYKVLEDECIWMKGGVVNFRLCDRAYDCFNCPFDKGMQRTMGGAKDSSGYKKPEWAKLLCKKYKGDNRPCRHYITGNISTPKTCPLNYECYHCSFDQQMDEMKLGSNFQSPEYYKAWGYKMADGFYFSKGHIWVCFEHGGTMRLGFDDFFAKLFSPLDSISLPALGKKIRKGNKGLRFERGEQNASILFPTDGTVISLNHKVIENPGLIQKDPYNDGWLLIIEPDSSKKQNKGLYFGEESVLWMEEEVQKLSSLLNHKYGELVATGGVPMDDLYGEYQELEWDKIVSAFLHT